ncbi:glycoside hydrolase family 26 protein [Streptomyces pyxinae]|uniref:glycoside hydrolase family 26 protein n=1 Tax=Streptomyces pyxinae TaxID=2970734 RepID=UPI003D164A74
MPEATVPVPAAADPSVPEATAAPKPTTTATTTATATATAEATAVPGPTAAPELPVTDPPASAPDASPAGPATPVPAAPGPPTTAVGAYLGFGPEGVSRMAELQKWLGGTELRAGHTYLPGDRWSNIEGRPGFLADWADWRRADPDRLLVLNVPMLERNEERLPDALVRQLLRLGAAGHFDRHYRALGERLVGLGVPDTVVVLGWEMNGTTYSHRCGPDPAAWKTYWKRIVTAMRKVPGQKFRFDFAPNRGRDAIPWTECYPGDDVVDIVGMDSYDQPPGETFQEQVDQAYGLRQQVEFAAAHGKAISYPEWGLFRNGDNTAYMRGMLEWMERHRPLYQTITDYCPHGVWQCGRNPAAAEVFRTALSAGRPKPTEPAPTESTPTEPAPTPTGPAPTRPPEAQQPGCTPIDLGPWIEQLLGHQVCVQLDGRRLDHR